MRFDTNNHFVEWRAKVAGEDRIEGSAVGRTGGKWTFAIRRERR